MYVFGTNIPLIEIIIGVFIISIFLLIEMIIILVLLIQQLKNAKRISEALENIMGENRNLKIIVKKDHPYKNKVVPKKKALVKKRKVLVKKRVVKKKKR